MLDKIKKANQGAIALLLVIMITALTIVSAAVISMTNISDLMSSFYFSQSEEADVEMDACLEDALWRLASSTEISGTYYLNTVGTSCYYQIADSIEAGLKTVTSTASTTSDVGYWVDAVIAQINVSTTPISIYSYKNFNMSYAPIVVSEGGAAVCGDGTITSPEVCDELNNTITEYCGDGNTDVGKCNADCSAVVPDETCDDGNTTTEMCGDGTQQNGTYCNANCTVETVLAETCDYTPGSCNASSCCDSVGLGCATGKRGFLACSETCTTCLLNCL